MLASEDPDFEGRPAGGGDRAARLRDGHGRRARSAPQDDIVTKLINADKDGRGLNDDEFGYFVMMLAVAGNETTRNAITHGMHAFLDQPRPVGAVGRGAARDDDRRGHPLGDARSSSSSAPRINDTMVGDVLVRKGQRVGLFYSSANYDEDVFEDPHTFNILRDPNPHLAFGGHGAHYCIGANLARQEIRLIFNALADHVPGIHLVAEPRRLRHGWVNGIKEMQVDYA